MRSTDEISTSGGSFNNEIVEAFADGGWRSSMMAFVVQAPGGGAPPGDADGDGFADALEVALGFEPFDADSTPPATPVAGSVGLGVLALGVLAGGAALVRRKK